MTKLMIVVPTDGEGGLDASPAQHFGRCDTYTFMDEAGALVKVVRNTGNHMGGSGSPPEILKKEGASVLICSGLGPKAIQMCADLGIAVFVCDAPDAKGMFGLWKSGSLSETGRDDACKDHHH